MCACADWADDSGKWGELTNSQSSALPVPPPQPMHSSVSLAEIARDAADNRAADERPDPSYRRRPQRGAEPGPKANKDAASRSYLSVLESLAREGEFGSPGNSDNDSSPAATQAHVMEQAWGADQFLRVGPQDPSLRGSYKAAAAEESSQLSEASSTFGDAPAEGLLPLEASDMHMDGTEGGAEGASQHGASGKHTHAGATLGSLQASHAGAAGDEQTARQLAEEEDQPSSLALALAALAATAAQKHAEQTSMQQPQPDAADFVNKLQTADADVDVDEQASVSSDSDCDVLASAAAAAAAAGLSRRRQNDEQAAQLRPVPAGARASAAEAQAEPREPLQDAEAGCSQVEFHTEHAQQEGRHQRNSASGDYFGPGSSGPSWSAAADGVAPSIGLFRENQAVNYVGKSARRPKVGLLCLELFSQDFGYAMPCYAMLCRAMPCCAMLCHAMPRYARFG